MLGSFRMPVTNQPKLLNMEMKRLTREADELIRKVVARYNSLYAPNGNISQLELDLLLDDLKLMYEKFKTIGILNLQKQHEEHLPVVAPTPAKSIEQVEQAPPAPPVMEKEAEKAEPVMDELVQKEEIAEEVKETETPVQEVIEENPVKPSEPESRETPLPAAAVTYTQPEPTATTLADRYRNEQKSIGEAISSGTGNDGSLGSKLGHNSVADLKSVIGLAEKFAFVNELFSGDTLAYEKAIVQLNSATRLIEAEAYLGTLKLNHRWPSDSPQAALLTNIVRRKFNQ